MASNKKVVTIGIGGASCSGKSTLARLLQKILPNCTILHQDDFFKPEEQIPINSTTNLANWDSPEAIDFDAFKDFIQQLHETGQFLISFESKEENVYNKQEMKNENEENESKLSVEGLSSKVNKKLLDYLNQNNNDNNDNNYNNDYDDDDDDEWHFVIIDGFLLYWDAEVIKELDIKSFISADHDVLKKRREERKGYVTREGYWVDPPNYFNDVVWPEHVKYNSHLLRESDELIILGQKIEENIEKIIIEILEFINKSKDNNNDTIIKDIEDVKDNIKDKDSSSSSSDELESSISSEEFDKCEIECNEKYDDMIILERNEKRRNDYEEILINGLLVNNIKKRKY
ncbi:hypothetical protein Glove_2g10 [Diversispora epigaea]|uniref:Phosphoribulokinase/uridine kinase domain-containing protein n=1 Tax=Diversispora epigaea TaxID=1348612 RepID=A0A397JPH0_9GLOM|nr:hypothetical protein Glove_2g10 [Diversispora epigaea]